MTVYESLVTPDMLEAVTSAFGMFLETVKTVVIVGIPATFSVVALTKGIDFMMKFVKKRLGEAA